MSFPSVLLCDLYGLISCNDQASEDDRKRCVRSTRLTLFWRTLHRSKIWVSCKCYIQLIKILFFWIFQKKGEHFAKMLTHVDVHTRSGSVRKRGRQDPDGEFKTKKAFISQVFKSQKKAKGEKRRQEPGTLWLGLPKHSTMTRQVTRDTHVSLCTLFLYV